MSDIKIIKDGEIYETIYKFSGFCPHCNKEISGEIDDHSNEWQCKYCKEWMTVDYMIIHSE